MEEAETEIRRITKDEFFKRSPKTAIDKKVFAVIRDAEKKITIPALADAARRSLLHFYQRQYDELRRSLTLILPLLIAAATLQDPASSAVQTARAKTVFQRQGYDIANLYGSALHKFADDYAKDNVQPALDRLAAQYPLDPNDESGRNSLRNRAEMEVRYNGHLDNIEELRSAGHKLVIASAHADCSERCRPWQGRVYSLDGTSGTTDDGRRYVPLEQATDVWYTTKAGKRYKNGLLGFNCRHYLIAYKSGYRFPKPNAKEERKQYEITETQRRLERNVRLWRTRAVEAQGANRKEYLQARAKAQEWDRRYREYSKANGRAYYPSRTKLL